jgi:hypothetical protein
MTKEEFEKIRPLSKEEYEKWRMEQIKSEVVSPGDYKKWRNKQIKLELQSPQYIDNL